MSDRLSGLVSFDYTHIMYAEGDIMGFVCSVLSLIPQIVLVIYATQALSRREIETFMMGAGQVVCEMFNVYLKHTLKQERPERSHVFQENFGMPSAHSQFMAYYSSYLILWMWLRMRHFSTIKKVSRSVGLILVTAGVAFSRVYLHYHTPLQVIVGVGAGSAVGLCWMLFVVLLRDLGLVDLLLDTPPARFFLIKDTACEKASFIQDEYSEWRRLRMKMKLLVKVD